MQERENDYLRITDGWEPSDSILQKKISGMVETTYPYLKNFPKTERHDLTARIKSKLYDLVELAVDCDSRNRKTALEKLDLQNKQLKKLVRLAFRLRFLAPKHDERWMALLKEIGQIIGGRLNGLGGK